MLVIKIYFFMSISEFKFFPYYKNIIEVIKMKENSKVYLDILRILACFLVIVNHTNSDIFLQMGPSLTWLFSISYFFVCRIAVPLFLMISGCLLLKKEDNYKKSFKRIFRIILVILIFSLIYYVDYCYKSKTSFDLIEYLKLIYQQHITNAFWYLYTYLGLLIMLPILQPIVKRLSQKKLMYFLGISFLFLGTMPILIHYFPHLQYDSYFELYLFSPFIGYFIAGYYIDNYIQHTKRNSIYAFIIFIISISISIIFTYFEYRKSYADYYLLFSDIKFIPIILASCSIFYLGKYYFQTGFSLKWNKIIHYLGGLTFGIYLLSDILIEKFWWIYLRLCEIGIHQILSILVLEIIVFLTGGIITVILKKVPFIKKII